MSIDVQAIDRLGLLLDIHLFVTMKEMEFATIPRFNPSFTPHKTNGTSSVGLNPAGSLTEWRFQEVELQNDTVGISTFNPFGFG